MSSRILHGDVAEPAEPIAWRRMAGPFAAPRELPEDDARRREQEAERRVAEARQAGFREGEAAGQSRARGELEPVLERAAQAIQEISSLRPRVLREAEASLLKLAIAIARRVLNRELSVDPEALGGLIRASLEKLESREIGRVRVNPEHAAIVEKLLAREAAGRRIEVVADGSLPRGSLIFETRRGALDASMDTQLAEIELGLADRLRSKS